jgi:hypothetical protein
MDYSRHQEKTSQENEEILLRKPLAYSDLVMAEYTEKRRTYKWPAIVHECLYLPSNDRSSLQTIWLTTCLTSPLKTTKQPLVSDGSNHNLHSTPLLSLFRRLYLCISSSWVPEASVEHLTPKMIEEFNKTIEGPKQLIAAWQMARTPPSVFEYMLEKKKSYYQINEVYKLLRYWENHRFETGQRWCVGFCDIWSFSEVVSFMESYILGVDKEIFVQKGLYLLFMVRVIICWAKCTNKTKWSEEVD